MTIENDRCRNGSFIENSIGKHQPEKTRVVSIHMPMAPIR